MRHQHIGLGHYMGRFSLRCEPVSVGSSVETDAAHYNWDNSGRGSIGVFQYTLSGTGIFTDQSGSEIMVPPGSAFIVTCPSVTRYRVPPGGEWEFIYITFSGDAAFVHADQIIARSGNVFHPGEGSLPVEMLKRLYRDASAGVRMDRYRLSELLYRILMGIYRETEPEEHYPASVLAGIRRMENDFADNSLTLDRLAEEAGVSRYHFIRLFKKYTGVTPYACLMKLRLDFALDSLLSTDWSVKEVAAKSGFTDVSYFCRAFKRVTGKSPGSLRSGLG